MQTILLQVMFIAMLPVLELRAVIPFGIAAGENLVPVVKLAIVGNLFPIPFLIIYTRKVFAWLRRYYPKAARFVTRMENRAHIKIAVVHKFGFWGICILVAIPLPGTGAWTGALMAAMLDMRLRLAFTSIALGVLIASIIIIIPSVRLFE